MYIYKDPVTRREKLRELELDEQANITEKREHPRTPIELKVEYRRLNTFFADYTKNISQGGTFIKTQKPLKINTEFIFKLYIPTLNDPLELTGQVQWVVSPVEATATKPLGMGIKFTYTNISEREKIESTVEKLMIDSLGKYLYEKLLKRYSSKPAGQY
jgi:type IV pilus assembly protein PilZ